MDESAVLKPPAVDHHFLNLPGGLTHYVEAGYGDPCLLIHGAHGSWTHWIRNIDELARVTKVMALDLPGFGDSFSPDAPPDLEFYVDAVTCLIRGLDLQGVAVAGFSFGGLIASFVARSNPDRVDRLLLINPTGLGASPPSVRTIEKQLSELTKAKSLRVGVEESLRRLMFAKPDAVNDDVIDLTVENVRRAKFKVGPIIAGKSLLDILQQVWQPTMVLLSTEDRRHPGQAYERKRRILAVAPTADVRLVEGAGHWLQWEHPEVFNEIAVSFLCSR